MAPAPVRAPLSPHHPVLPSPAGFRLPGTWVHLSEGWAQLRGHARPWSQRLRREPRVGTAPQFRVLAHLASVLVVLVVKSPPPSARDIKDASLIPGSGRKWQPTPVFSPGRIPQTEELGGLQSIESESRTRPKQLSRHTACASDAQPLPARTSEAGLSPRAASVMPGRLGA